LPLQAIAVVDGTGEFSDESYAKSMANSFCTQIGQQLGGASGVMADYQRGPTGEGARTGQKGREAAAILKRVHGLDRNAQLFLAGYSRGGSAAIIAAETLQKDGVPVKALFLFDPVARHMCSGGEVIPANVRRAYVAYRALDADIVARYEATISAGGAPMPDKIGKFSVWKAATLFNPVGAAIEYVTNGNPIRPTFGKTATQMAGPRFREDGKASMVVKTFRGSHGALGGVGWKMVKEDVACQEAVAGFMNDAMDAEGLKGVRLTGITPIL
jgi:pimeloyl-ACP methyl ester carboxylesterase